MARDAPNRGRELQPATERRNLPILTTDADFPRFAAVLPITLHRRLANRSTLHGQSHVARVMARAFRLVSAAFGVKMETLMRMRGDRSYHLPMTPTTLLAVAVRAAMSQARPGDDRAAIQAVPEIAYDADANFLKLPPQVSLGEFQA